MGLNGTAENPVESFVSIPILIIVMMRILAGIIIFLNGVVFLWFIVTRHSILPVITLQTSCLCFADILTGTGILILSYTDHRWFRQSLNNCSSAIAFFLASQLASIYNVLSICMHRFFSLRRMEQIVIQLKKSRVICSSVLAFLLAVLAGAMPFLIFAQHEKDIVFDGCSGTKALNENRTIAMMLLCAVFLLPLLITNSLYVYLMFRLRQQKRQQHRAVEQYVTDTTSPLPCSDVMTPINQHKPTTRASFTDIKDRDISTRDGIEIAPQGVDTDVAEQRNTDFTKNDLPTYPKARAGPHQKAFTILGFILLFLNIFAWPAVISVLIEAQIGIPTRAINDRRFFICTMALNSVINPIIYTINLPELRKDLLEIILLVFSLFKTKNARPTDHIELSPIQIPT